MQPRIVWLASCILYVLLKNNVKVGQVGAGGRRRAKRIKEGGAAYEEQVKRLKSRGEFWEVTSEQHVHTVLYIIRHLLQVNHNFECTFHMTRPLYNAMFVDWGRDRYSLTTTISNFSYSTVTEDQQKSFESLNNLQSGACTDGLSSLEEWFWCKFLAIMHNSLWHHGCINAGVTLSKWSWWIQYLLNKDLDVTLWMDGLPDPP